MTTPRLRAVGAEHTAHDVAADWILRIETGKLSSSEQLRLERWLDEAPEHRAAFASEQRALDLVAMHAGHPDMMALRAEALALRPHASRSYLHLATYASAAAGVAALIWAGLSAWPLGTPARRPGGSAVAANHAALTPVIVGTVYRTAVGERASITLPDGSVATLDTSSEVRVAYSPQERGVTLLRGQALFEVAKHKPMPFQVYAGNQRITAVGTKFDVRLGTAEAPTAVTVAMLGGAVRVTELRDGAPAYQAQSAVLLTTGQMLVANPTGVSLIQHADVEGIASWRNGLLTFNDMPLKRAVDEINRYSPHSLALADRSLGDLRISGVFRAGDPERFAKTVAEIFPVKTVRGSTGGLLLQPASHR